MTIEWFDNESTTTNELPWVKEYIANNGLDNVLAFVEHCYECPTGMLVLTEEWKGFAYKNSKAYTQLAEALAVYITQEIPIHRLVVRSNSSGRLAFGVDKSFTDAVWVKHGRECTQMYGDNAIEHSEFKKRTVINPLLASIPTNGKRAQETPERSQSKRGKSTP